MIVALPPKTLSSADKAKLTKKGYVVIEIDDPEKVRIINIESPIATNDMVMALLQALADSGSGSSCLDFVRGLNKRLKNQESAANQQTTAHAE